MVLGSAMARAHYARGGARPARSGSASRPAMDLLEYQGKQLFARHGVPVPAGREATKRRGGDRRPPTRSATRAWSRRRCRSAAAARPAASRSPRTREEAEAARQGDPRHGHPRPHRPRAVDRGGLGHRRRVLRVDRLRPLGQGAAGACSRPRAGWTSRRWPRRTPTRSPACTSTRCSGFQDFHGRRLAFEAGVDADVVRPVGAMLAKLYDAFIDEEAMLVEVNPLIVTAEREVRGARRQGHARRQLAVPPRRQRRAARPVGRGPAGADGQGARPDLRQARRRTSASSATAPGW